MEKIPPMLEALCIKGILWIKGEMGEIQKDLCQIYEDLCSL